MLSYFNRKTHYEELFVFWRDFEKLQNSLVHSEQIELFACQEGDTSLR